MPKAKPKEVALFGGQSPAAAVGSLRKLANARMQGDALFLKLTKQGEWLYGPEEIEVEADDEWAINPNSFKVGVIGWRNGSVVGEHMFPIYSGQTVDMAELEEIAPVKDGDGWKDQTSLELRAIGENLQLLWATSSLGGRNAIAALADAIATQAETDEEHAVPVVTLASDFYKHKTYGKIFTPELKIVRWVDMDGNPPGGGKKKLV